MVTFEPLAHHPHHIDELSQWMFQMWGQFYPGSSVETTRRWINMTMRDSGLPITQLALEGETLVGCAMLQEQELYKENNLTPWLGALLVKEKYQNQGIGSQLHDWAIAHIKSLNYKKLHLLTFDANYCEWYERKGWKIIKTDDSRGYSLIIMETAIPLFADNRG